MSTMKSSNGVKSPVKNPSEETFPLLLQLLEEERPFESESPDDSPRGKRVNNGVALLLGRWPGYITTGCILGAFLSIITILTIIMILIILIMMTLDTNSTLSHNAILRRETSLLGIETSCNYLEQEEEIINNITSKKGNSKDMYNFFKFMSVNRKPASIVNHSNESNIESLNAGPYNVFFITTEQHLPSEQICAIESAAHLMKNYTYFLIVISLTDKETKTVPDKRFQQVMENNKNIKLINLKAKKYFFDSPLHTLASNKNCSSSVIEFAARVLTLWRYSGITFSLDLVTLNTSRTSYPIPNNENSMVSRDGGSVMSARLQCHAFLFEMMKSMMALYEEKHNTCNISSNEVIQRALKYFCLNVISKRISTDGPENIPHKICRGVSAMPQNLICKNISENEVNKDQCLWLFCPSENNLKENFCPILFKNVTSKNLKNEKLHVIYNVRHRSPD